MKQHFLTIIVALLFAVPTLHADQISFGGKTYNVERTETQLASGVKYTKLHITDIRYSGYNSGSMIHVVEADLSDPTVSVKHGDSGRDTRRSLATQAANLSTSTSTVVAGANANFWCTSEQPWATKVQYEPFGVSIKDGKMYTDPNCGTTAHVGGPTVTGMLAIDENGRCFIDYLNPQVNGGANSPGSGWHFTLTNHNTAHPHTFGIDQVNRVVCPGTAAMYNAVYGSSKAFRTVVSAGDYSTYAGSDCVEILMDFAEGTSDWHIGGDTHFVIKEVRKNTKGNGSLGNHDCAIVCRDSYATVANAWEVGDEMTITARVNFKSQGSPGRILQATSGNCICMENGVVGYNPNQESYNSNFYARTLYGTNDAGNKLWIAVCEHYPNQQRTYVGFSTKEMAELLKYFGATWATQVDCGGSSQMYAGGKQVSTSTDSGGLRNVQSGVFILSTPNATGTTPKPVPAAPVLTGEEAYWKESENAAYARFSWTKPEGTDNFDTEHYVDGAWTPFQYGFGADFTTLDWKMPNQTTKSWTFRVRARNANGTSSWSNEVTLKYEAPIDPTDWALHLNYEDVAIAELEGKTVKRVVPSNDGSHLYILAHDASNAPTLLVYNHETKTVKEQLGTTPVVATSNPSLYKSVSDIDVTDDDYLVAIGQDMIQANGSHHVFNYKWRPGSDGIATGQCLNYEESAAGQWNVFSYRAGYTTAVVAGEAMAFYGKVNGGYMIYTIQKKPTSGTEYIRWERIRLAPQITEESYSKISGETAREHDLFLDASPHLGLNAFLMNEADDQMYAYTNWKASSNMTETAVNLFPTATRHTPIFGYNNQYYMVGATATGVVLADVTNGIATGKAIELDLRLLASNTTANVAAAGTAFNAGKDVALFVLRDGKISRYSSIKNEDTPTAIEDCGMRGAECEVRKVVENGQIVIIRDGIRYNILGNVIQ